MFEEGRFALRALTASQVKRRLIKVWGLLCQTPLLMCATAAAAVLAQFARTRQKQSSPSASELHWNSVQIKRFLYLPLSSASAPRSVHPQARLSSPPRYTHTAKLFSIYPIKNDSESVAIRYNSLPVRCTLHSMTTEACDPKMFTAAVNSMPQLMVVNSAIHVSNSMCVTAAESSGIAMPTNFGGFEVSDCKQYHNRLMLSKETRKSPPPAFGSNFGAKEAVVSSVTIESLVNEHALTSLHAIKLDCEGAEHLALQGGLQALKQFCPAIFFEVRAIMSQKLLCTSTATTLPDSPT